MHFPKMEHFVNLARNGKLAGASGGEVRARKLAFAILENAPGLDARAIEEAMEFLRVAPLAPSGFASMIDADE